VLLASERFNLEFAFEMPKNAGRNRASTGKRKASALLVSADTSKSLFSKGQVMSHSHHAHSVSQMRIPCRISILSLLLIAGGFGCGNSSDVQTVPVTGVVTFEGQPVDGATVYFAPEKGPAARAETDEEGKFSLMTNRPGDGAVPGKFKVGIAKFVPDMKTANDPVPGMKNTLPDKYNNPTSSGLTATVDLKGNEPITFNLKK
jgi:hypothetical protein